MWNSPLIGEEQTPDIISRELKINKAPSLKKKWGFNYGPAYESVNCCTSLQ